MNFHGVDLNLLAAFDALMRERNVTRAATEVGVSQPAMSAALSRLRKHFGDQLFLRSADGLLPTPRARDLAEPLSKALEMIKETVVTNPEFDPAKASLTFNLGLSDYPAFVLLPLLLKEFGMKAPGVSLNVHAFSSRDDAVDMLDAGVIDAAIGVPPTHSDSRILTRSVLRDDFVVIVASEHPVARLGMSMETYLALSHILVSPEGDRYGLVDQELARQGETRLLALTLPQMFAVPAVVAQTQMTATVMKRVALGSSACHKLVLFPPPVRLPSVIFDLIWHRRSNANPAQNWLRSLIEGTAARL